MVPNHDDDWEVWKNHVLEELKRQNQWLGSIQRTMNSIEVELAVLKVKAGMWGAMGGIATTVGTMLIGWLISRR